MATTNSATSDSVEPQVSAFVADRVVNSFPRHEVVKLDEGTFVQWKQQVRFIVNGYNLFGFLDESVSPQLRFMQAPDGALVVNSTASVYHQQGNLITSWLLSTINSSILSSFTNVQTASDVWTTALALFAADTDLKQSRLRHDLHSIKKGNLSIRDYVGCVLFWRPLILRSRWRNERRCFFPVFPRSLTPWCRLLHCLRPLFLSSVLSMR